MSFFQESPTRRWYFILYPQKWRYQSREKINYLEAILHWKKKTDIQRGLLLRVTIFQFVTQTDIFSSINSLLKLHFHKSVYMNDCILPGKPTFGHSQILPDAKASRYGRLIFSVTMTSQDRLWWTPFVVHRIHSRAKTWDVQLVSKNR